MWHSGFTSIVSHLGGGRTGPLTIEEDAPEPDGACMQDIEGSDESEEVAENAPNWGKVGRSGGRMGAVVKSDVLDVVPKMLSAPNNTFKSASAVALQRAVEDIRSTMAKSIVSSTGNAEGPIVVVPPQPAAQEMFRKRFEKSTSSDSK